jgi:transposase-like protein
MRRKPESHLRKQVKAKIRAAGGMAEVVDRARSMLREVRETLTSTVVEAGLLVFQEILEEDATAVAGTRYRNSRTRKAYRWGSTQTGIPFGGREVVLSRPRVRRKGGPELELPTLSALRGADPLSERVMEQILLGVSTRGYERSLPELPKDRVGRGASKSAVSRRIQVATARAVQELLERRLENLDLVALAMDGVGMGESTVVAALGITLTGEKHVLGLWQGSTENTALCASLLHNLIERGLNVEQGLLLVLDGGKGLRAAVRDVLGDAALVQRCQVHKMRNLKSHLPEKRHAYVLRTMRDAYHAKDKATAKKKLLGLVGWLDRQGEDGAAKSLREGLDETLTVLDLKLPTDLRRTLATTNVVENLIGSVRRVTRNVKRWRSGAMALRWAAQGVLAAEKSFRRLRHHKNLPLLRKALSERLSQKIAKHVRVA